MIAYIRLQCNIRDFISNNPRLPQVCYSEQANLNQAWTSDEFAGEKQNLSMVLRSVILFTDKHWKHNLLDNKAFTAAFLSPSILCLQHIPWSKDGSLTFRFKMKGNWIKKKQWISYCLLYAGTCRTEICKVMQFLYCHQLQVFWKSLCYDCDIFLEDRKCILVFWKNDLILSPVCHILINVVYVEKVFLHFELVELVFN